jgi:hypothetical protein
MQMIFTPQEKAVWVRGNIEILAGVLKLQQRERNLLYNINLDHGIEFGSQSLEQNSIAETHSLISKPEQKRQESRRVKRKEKPTRTAPAHCLNPRSSLCRVAVPPAEVGSCVPWPILYPEPTKQLLFHRIGQCARAGGRMAAPLDWPPSGSGSPDSSSDVRMNEPVLRPWGSAARFTVVGLWITGLQFRREDERARAAALGRRRGG